MFLPPGFVDVRAGIHPRSYGRYNSVVIVPLVGGYGRVFEEDLQAFID
jgi:hypothetical protein